MSSLRATITALQQRQLSSVELTHHYLQQIKHHASLNAFIAVDEDYALQQARIADQQLDKQLFGLLTGIPMAHKDIFCTEHFATTCASKMLENYHSPYQATLVSKLQAQGAITLGKTNMDEFAMGSANENSYFGAVKNPWDTSRVAGGSSGGSAAAVAARLIPFATGSDTGGSIRQPAAFCNVTGLKPTYGLVSRFGMVAFASSLDQAGAFAPSADDVALVLQAMAGFDVKDSTSVNQAVPDYSASLNDSIKGLRIGLPKCFFQQGTDSGILQALDNAVHSLQSAGAKLVEIDLAHQSLWVPCYYIIACAEASSNLSRFDGIRFGHRAAATASIQELITASRSEGFGKEVKRRILTGTYVLSSGYFDAYYLQALKIRRLIKEELQQALKEVDVILGPTTPTCAFKLGEKINDPVQNYLADIFTVAVNLAGLPAISIPAGFHGELPVGMQIIGSYFSEARLLNIAHCFQTLTNWHQVSPTLRYKS